MIFSRSIRFVGVLVSVIWVWSLGSCGILYAQELRVCTLNCNWYFKPGLKKAQIAGDAPTTLEDYEKKGAQLADYSARSGAEFYGLQEVGGEAPLKDLAHQLAKTLGVPTQTGFVTGRDTYTGQNVGAILMLQKDRWTIISSTRVRELDALVSKHLLVKMRAHNGKTLNILVLHLIRPIGKSEEKHATQIAGIRKWMDRVWETSPDQGYIVMGDLNTSEKPPGPLGMAPWADLFSTYKAKSTHVSGRGLYDRIIASPNLEILKGEIGENRLGGKGNDMQRMLLTDHLSLTATIHFKEESKK